MGTERGGGYVLLHAGAGGERRDVEEEERISEREAAEFPGIVVMLSPFQGRGIKEKSGGRLVCRSSRQLGRDGMPDENKA